MSGPLSPPTGRGVAVHLAREVLRRGRPFQDRARGGSMRPLVPAGSDLTVVPCAPDALLPGDVVLVALRHGAGPPATRLVAHRLLVAPTAPGAGADGRPARTKGDRARRPDPPVAPEDVLGLVVAATLPDGRRRALRTPAARLLGLALAIASPWLGVAETVLRSLRATLQR